MSTVRKEELGLKLRKMYELGGTRGESVVMIHLFGIRFAEEIKSGGHTPADIIAASEIPASFATELAKGIELTRHVDEKPTGTLSRAQQGLDLLKSAILDFIIENPTGVDNSDIANKLGLRSDYYQGGSKNYLIRSLLGLLLDEGKVRRNSAGKYFSAESRNHPPRTDDADRLPTSPTCRELTSFLRRTWDEGYATGRSKTMLVVFGVRFCSQLGQGRQCAVDSVVRDARLKVPGHANTVRLGMSIAPFVRLRDEPLPELRHPEFVPSISRLGDELRRMRADPRYQDGQTAVIFVFGVLRAPELRALYGRERDVTSAAGITADHTSNIRLAQQVSLHLEAVERIA